MIRQVYPNELYHSGIKGQRWGVRRFQNEDRTWTAAGKARYGSGKIEKRARKERAAIDKARSSAKTDADIERERREAAERAQAKAEAKQARAEQKQAKQEQKSIDTARKEQYKAIQEAEAKQLKQERLKKAAIIAGAAIVAYGGVKLYKNFKAGGESPIPTKTSMPKPKSFKDSEYSIKYPRTNRTTPLLTQKSTTTPLLTQKPTVSSGSSTKQQYERGKQIFDGIVEGVGRSTYVKPSSATVIEGTFREVSKKTAKKTVASLPAKNVASLAARNIPLLPMK